MDNPENKRKVMSQVEAMVLRPEAERRVRAGQSRAEVGRQLGIHPMTLAQWALAGGWRQVDLERERAGELSGAASRRIDAAVEREADHAAMLGQMRHAAQERAEEQAGRWDADAWTLEGMAHLPDSEIGEAATDPDFLAYREQVLAPLRQLRERLDRERAAEVRHRAQAWSQAAEGMTLPGVLGED